MAVRTLNMVLATILPLPVVDPAAYMRKVAQMIQYRWRQVASSNLQASDRSVSLYKSALTHRSTDTSASVTLDASAGPLPLMLEQGMGPGGIGTQGSYDLRTFLLRETTSNIRRDKKGNLYLNVPFGMSAAQIKALGGPKVAKMARELAPTTSTRAPGSSRFQTTWGGRLPEGLVPKQAAHHATDPLAGVVREQKQYQGSTRAQSTYRKWRRLSATGKPWISRGIAARALALRVLQDIPAILRKFE